MPTGTKAPAPAGTLRAAISYTIGGNDNAVNVLWFNTIGYGSATDADVSSFLTTLLSDWGEYLMGQAGTNVTMVGAKGVLYTGTFEYAAEVEVDVVGTLTGNLPNAATGTCINWQIPAYYRGGHPRTLAPFGSSSVQFSASLWEPSFQNTVYTQAGMWLSHINTATTTNLTSIKFAAVSFVKGGAYRVTPVVYEPPAVNFVQQRMASVRRRLGPTIEA